MHLNMTASYDERSGDVILRGIGWAGQRKMRVLLAPVDKSVNLQMFSSAAQAEAVPADGNSLHVTVKPAQSRQMVSVHILFYDENGQPMGDVAHVGDVFCGFYRAMFSVGRKVIADKFERVELRVYPDHTLIEAHAMCYLVDGVKDKYTVPIELPNGKWTHLPGFDVPRGASVTLTMRDGLKQGINYVFEEKR